jgi:hypothetical protein
MGADPTVSLEAPRIERLYTLQAVSEVLGIRPRYVQQLAADLKLTRRLERNGWHGYRRVYTTSDLEAISHARIARATRLAYKNTGFKKSDADRLNAAT